MPKNQLGKWSLGLIAAMPVLFFVGMSFTNLLYESVPAGNSNQWCGLLKTELGN